MKNNIAILCLIACPQPIVGAAPSAAQATRSIRMAALVPEFAEIVRKSTLEGADLRPDELSFFYEYITINATPEQKRTLTQGMYDMALASEDLEQTIKDIRFSKEDLKAFLKHAQNQEAAISTMRGISEDEKGKITLKRKMIQLAVDKDSAGVLYLSNEEKQARINEDKARAGISSMSAADRTAKRNADLAKMRARKAGQ